MQATSTQQSAPRYRADIDGLRAVAVLLVVFSHLEVNRFSGGYIGVDVFFVISGYLISGILLREIAAGTFSFATFYERRVRRIAPALLATLAATVCLAHHYLFPPALYDYARTLLAALLSSSNFVLMQYWKYFDPENQTRPLLHTWSLAVEEQYYLVFPLLLVAIHRWWPRARKPIIWALAAISFTAVCVQMHYSYGQYTIAFFVSPLRAWELLIGTILYDLPTVRRAWLRNVLSAVGLLCIMLPAHFYTSQTTFPGLAALPPCLGAAMIIAAGETGSSLVGSILSWRPVRFIGIISYSLYLVHWPILIFQRDSEFLINAELHPRLVKKVVLAVSLLVATFSWRFIEMPFRAGRLRPTRRQLYAIVGPVFAMLLVVAALLIRTHGWPLALFPRADSAAAERYYQFGMHASRSHPGKCFALPDEFAEFTPSQCLTEDPNRPNWLLFGDSHAEVFYEGLQDAYPGVNISEASMAACRPIVTQSNYVNKSCNQLNSLIFHDYVLHHPLDAVILDQRWGWWMIQDLGDTIAFLKNHGIHVVVIGPSVEYDLLLPRLIVVAEKHHDTIIYANHQLSTVQDMDNTLAWHAREHWNVPYISMYTDLCHPDPNIPDPSWQVRSGTGCPIFASAHAPMMWDDNHLTPEGAHLFANAIKERSQLP